MTNEQIITDIAMQIYGADTVMQMLSDGIEPPLHTLQGWTARGYKVKKGEHAIAETRLWKKRKKKEKESEQASDEQSVSIPSNGDFCLCRSFLFGMDQVEKVKKE